MNVSRWFERAERTDGTSFVRLTEDRPEWLYEVVQDMHDGELSNDWRYDTARSIVASFDDADNGGYAVNTDEIADGLVDIYNAELIAWMGDNLNRIGDVDSANEEYGWAHDGGIIGMIRTGQFAVIDAMVRQYADAVECWDENYADEFTCDVHEECPIGDDDERSACYAAWKLAQFGGAS